MAPPFPSPLSSKTRMFRLWLDANELPSLLSGTDSGDGGCPLSADQCGYSSSRLVFPLATVADFLIVYLRNKGNLPRQAFK